MNINSFQLTSSQLTLSAAGRLAPQGFHRIGMAEVRAQKKRAARDSGPSSSSFARGKGGAEISTYSTTRGHTLSPGPLKLYQMVQKPEEVVTW